MLVGQKQKNVAMLMLHGVMNVHEYRHGIFEQETLPEHGMCWPTCLQYRAASAI